jgi:hypothetical protein
MWGRLQEKDRVMGRDEGIGMRIDKKSVIGQFLFRPFYVH